MPKTADDGVPRDKAAGRLLRELRENQGLSPEQMPHAMLAKKLTPVSGPTIRRVEDIGAIPQVRHRFALAQFFDRQVTDIWRGKARRRVVA
ncbi:MAG: hypothetical protein QOF68_1748 [Gaiellales bacterium]|jgi:hypothetical protein|nr:hypothetical protein [Gaiellales bacterium]